MVDRSKRTSHTSGLSACPNRFSNLRVSGVLKPKNLKSYNNCFLHFQAKSFKFIGIANLFCNVHNSSEFCAYFENRKGKNLNNSKKPKDHFYKSCAFTTHPHQLMALPDIGLQNGGRSPAGRRLFVCYEPECRVRCPSIWSERPSQIRRLIAIDRLLTAVKTVFSHPGNYRNRLIWKSSAISVDPPRFGTGAFFPALPQTSVFLMRRWTFDLIVCRACVCQVRMKSGDAVMRMRLRPREARTIIYFVLRMIF